MNLTQYKSERLQELKTLLSPDNETLNNLVYSAFIKNKWFTVESIWKSINAIKNEFLNEEKLNEFLSNYKLKETSKTIGIITAGNIPLVGFHDVLCAFLVNAPCKIKLSSKDEALMKFMITTLAELDITWKADITERLTDFDAIIATGSDNSFRYFEQYFKKVPNILRKNRNSIAILNGKETAQELDLLSSDIFEYFGLGCRNISKIFVPQGYDITQLFTHLDNYKEYVNHNLYKDNYDYNRTLLLMNLDPHLANDFVILKEDESMHSRLATIHYSFYSKPEEIQDYLIANNEKIQVVVSKPSGYWKSANFGETQQPKLSDYADNVDTISFLLNL